MYARNSEAGYGWVAQWLHWVIAALIITQFVLAQLAEAAGDEHRSVRQLGLLANHKSVGITVLMLAIVRLCWRWGSTVPSLPRAMPRWQVQASRVSHGLLYLLILALPMSGWLMSSASAYSVSWFNLFQLPDLIGASEPLKAQLLETHHLLATALFAVASLHVLAALKHHFLDRNDVLRRMLSATSAGAFVVILAAAVWATSGVGAEAPPPAPMPLAAAQTAGPLEPGEPKPPTAEQSEIAPWDIDYPASYIRFRAEQAGASFDGSWPDWHATVRFLPDRLPASSAEVEIHVAAVSTGDRDRDETILSADWFAAADFPTASFSCHDFAANADGTFTANAQLTIRDLTTPVSLNFTLATNAAGDRRILDGSTRLDRLAMQLGRGEWVSTTWVGQFVDVQVHVEARLQP